VLGTTLFDGAYMSVVDLAVGVPRVGGSALDLGVGAFVLPISDPAIFAPAVIFRGGCGFTLSMDGSWLNRSFYHGPSSELLDQIWSVWSWSFAQISAFRSIMIGIVDLGLGIFDLNRRIKPEMWAVSGVE